MYYYKLMMSDEFGVSYEYVSVNNEEELKEYMRGFSADFNDKYKVNVIEVTVEECLKEEEDILEHRLFSKYFKKHYDPDVITEREYSKLQKRFREDPEFRWQVLREINSEERKG